MANRLVAVSSTTRVFDDDVAGVCSLCARQVHYRPHTPIVDVRVCVNCYETRLATPQDVPMITAESRREIAIYLATEGKARH